MTEDPIVAEVRRIREEYARRFNYDLDAMFRDIQEKQSRSGRTYVSFPPKRPAVGGSDATVGKVQGAGP
jgi:hypothetical protein